MGNHCFPDGKSLHPWEDYHSPGVNYQSPYKNMLFLCWEITMLIAFV